jgi:hypothetical protein
MWNEGCKIFHMLYTVPVHNTRKPACKAAVFTAGGSNLSLPSEHIFLCCYTLAVLPFNILYSGVLSFITFELISHVAEPQRHVTSIPVLYITYTDEEKTQYCTVRYMRYV